MLETPAGPLERAVYNLENSDAVPACKSMCENINH